MTEHTPSNVPIPKYITEVFDKMRTELKGMYRVILKSTPKDDWAVKWNDCLDEVLDIIDKYKAEVESQIESEVQE